MNKMIFVLLEIDSSKCIYRNIIIYFPHIFTWFEAQLKCHPLTEKTSALAPCALCMLDTRTLCHTCHQVSL